MLRPKSCLLATLVAICGQCGAQELSGKVSSFQPYIDLQSMYDNNLFRLPGVITGQQQALLAGGSREDTMTTGSIGANGAWALGRQFVTLMAQGDYNRFKNNTSLNNWGAESKLDWHWQITDQWYGDAGANYERALASFANNFFLGRDSLSTLGYSGRLNWQVGPHVVASAAASSTETTHSATVRQIDNFDGDTGSVDLSYSNPLSDIFGCDYRYSTGDFAHEVTIDGSPFDRSYRDSTFEIHTTYHITGKTTLRANYGYLKRRYLNANIGNFGGDVWRATLDWQVEARTKITVAAWHELTAYVDSESNYFVTNGVSISPSWQVTRKLALSLVGSHERESFIGSNPEPLQTGPREDIVESAQLLAIWKPRKYLTATIGYQLAKRDSTISVLEFDDSLVSVDLRLTL